MFSHVFLSFLCLFCFSLPFISFHCFSVVAPAFLAFPAFLCLSWRPSLVFPCFFLLLIAFLLLVLFWRIVHCFNGFRLLWRLLPLLFIAFLMFHTFPSLALCFLVCHFTLMDNPSASYEQSSFILYSLLDYAYNYYVLVSCLFALRPEFLFFALWSREIMDMENGLRTLISSTKS